MDLDGVAYVHRDVLPAFLSTMLPRLSRERTTFASALQITHPHRLFTSPLLSRYRAAAGCSSGNIILRPAALQAHATQDLHGETHIRKQVAGPMKLPQGVLQHQVPHHVALIMDGNHRWAAARGLPAWVGHERGVSALRTAVLAACDWGITALTVYAFSADNWQRDASEVAFLMGLFETALQQQLPELQQRGVRLTFMGDLQRLPHGLQQQLAACEVATAHNTQLLLNIALSYSAQQDMISAVQRLAQQVQHGQLSPQQISAALLSQHLASSAATAAAGPPDLLVRTSGEQRLSNFMLWECAYTELCFLEVMWPDFNKQQFGKAVQQFAQRQRRFGRRS